MLSPAIEFPTIQLWEDDLPIHGGRSRRRAAPAHTPPFSRRAWGCPSKDMLLPQGPRGQSIGFKKFMKYGIPDFWFRHPIDREADSLSSA